MLGLLILALVAIGLALHVGKVAPERGRSAPAWSFLVILAAVAGWVIGSACEALLESAQSAPVLLVLMLNSVVLGCVPALGVVLALYKLPTGAIRLGGTSWEFDRLGKGERVVLSVECGIRVRSKDGELIADAGDIKTVRADGECLALDCGAEIGKLVLCPVDMPSREVRMRFVEALHERIQHS